MVEKLVSEAEWNDALAGLPAFSLPLGPVIVLAPHPDDESLATGGLVAALAHQQTALSVVAITDGEAAYDPAGDQKLARLRRQEQTAALSILGVYDEQILRLRLPDRWVHEHETALSERLIDLLVKAGPTATVIAPWSSDFHSDHEAIGRAAERATEQMGTALVRWFWWSWHRRSIAEMTALPLKRFAFTPQWLELKLAAIHQHKSQLGADAILPYSILAPAHRCFEVFA